MRLALAVCFWLVHSGSIASEELTTGPAHLIASKLNEDAREQVGATLASSGNEALAVWQLGRAYFQRWNTDIYAVRLGEYGKPVGDVFPICTTPDGQQGPKVAYSNGRYLVAWQDFRNGQDWDVYVTLVTREGFVLRPNGFLLAGGPGNQALPDVAPAPFGFVVVWQSIAEDGFYELHAATIDAQSLAFDTKPLEYPADSRQGSRGYKPRYGVDTLPISSDRVQNNHVTGGWPSIVALDDGWLLFWSDETGWGTERILNHVARLRVNEQKHLELTRVNAAASQYLGGQGVRQAGDGKDSVLYVRALALGRSNQNRLAIGGFYDATSGTWLPQPLNQDGRARVKWLKGGKVFIVFPPSLPIDSPVAAAFNQGVYFVVARGTAYREGGHPERLYARRIPADRWPVQPQTIHIIHESSTFVHNPVLSNFGEGFLLLYEEEDDQGVPRLWSRFIRVSNEEN